MSSIRRGKSTRDFPKGRWEARYRDPAGVQRTRTFDRKDQAEDFLATTRHQKRQGDYLDPEQGRLPYRHFAAEWLRTTVHLKPRTHAGYRNIVDDRLIPRFGDIPVAQISKSTVRGYVAEMQQQGRKPQTIRNVFFALRASLNIAVENGALRANPCSGIKLPSNETAGNEVTINFLTAEQVALLAAAIREPYGPMIYMAAYTGLRAGELCALRVQDLDLLRRRVHVRASIAEVDGKLMRVATKTKRQRTVGLPVFLSEMLAAYLQDRPHGSDDLVFDDPTRPDTWLRHANWYVTHFKPAVKAAGLPANLRFHDLRHTCASLLIAQGADPKAVSTRLGHTTVQMTLDRYTHLFANRDDEITANLDTMHRAVQAAVPATTDPLPNAVVALR